MHVVWLQAEHAPTSPVQSPTSSDRCPSSPSPSAVGFHLERISVSPTPAPTAPTSGLVASPPRRGGGGGSGGSSPKSSKPLSPQASRVRSLSPTRTAPRVGAASAPDKPGVSKDIELEGLSAYTKESTADWVVTPAEMDGDDDGGRNVDQKLLRPVPPTGAREASAAVAASDASRHASAGSHAATADGGGHGVDQPPEAGCGTASVFIMRPLRARGTLVIYEGVTGAQAAQASAAESDRSGTGPWEGAGGDPPAGGDGLAGGGGSVGFPDERGNEPPALAAVSLDVDALALQVNIRQYAVLNEAVSALAMSQRRFRFRSVRPTTAVLEDPEAWWRYAIGCVYPRFNTWFVLNAANRYMECQRVKVARLGLLGCGSSNHARVFVWIVQRAR